MIDCAILRSAGCADTDWVVELTVTASGVNSRSGGSVGAQGT
jgi:hypothetical protein